MDSKPKLKAGDTVKIKPQWHQGGTTVEVVGEPIFRQQWWVPIIDPHEGEDPTFIKAAALDLNTTKSLARKKS